MTVSACVALAFVRKNVRRPCFMTYSLSPQVLRLIAQLSMHKENAENILVCGSLQAVNAIVGSVLEDGGKAMIRCREVMISCLTIIREVAKTGPVRLCVCTCVHATVWAIVYARLCLPLNPGCLYL